MRCYLCREENAQLDTPTSFTFGVACNYCGNYKITKTALDLLRENAQLASDCASWVHEQCDYGMRPTITGETIEFLRVQPRPNIKHRVELFLKEAIKLIGSNLNGRVRLSDPALRVASWSHSNTDSVAISKYLDDIGALECTETGQEAIVTTKAHFIVDEWAETRGLSSQVFVAMWFSDEVRDAYENGIYLAIKNAGYEPIRIDRTEYEGRIDDEIIAEIRRSAFLVADFTGHRGGVYYEAGFAHGLGRRVIFTCRSDYIDDLHFDVRQYNTIKWRSVEEIVPLLQNRILALFGAGPLKPDARPLPQPEALALV